MKIKGDCDRKCEECCWQSECAHLENDYCRTCRKHSTHVNVDHREQRPTARMYCSILVNAYFWESKQLKWDGEKWHCTEYEAEA